MILSDKKKGPGLDVGIASILNAASSFTSDFYSAEINSIIAEMNQAQSEFNARMAERNAVDAIERGNEEALSYRKKVNSLIGTQRANAAAQGIAVDFGSVEQNVEQTYEFGQEDARTIKNNAWKQAFGFKAEAAQHRISGMIGQIQADSQRTNTLIGGGLRAAQTGLRTYESLSRSSGSGNTLLQNDLQRNLEDRG